MTNSVALLATSPGTSMTRCSNGSWVAIDLTYEDLWLADLEFAPSRRMVSIRRTTQDAASVDVPLVFAVGGFDAEREVALEFGVEAFTDVAVRNWLSLPKKGDTLMVNNRLGGCSSTAMRSTVPAFRGRRSCRRFQTRPSR